MSESGAPPIAMRLRAFDEGDFDRLISWVPTAEALAHWCAAFFSFPLDRARLQRYLESARQPNAREIFTAVTDAGEAVGHIEVSMIWPHLSSRLSRVLVAPQWRGRGIGTAMVGHAAALSFARHQVDRIDLGVSRDNAAAIACYRKQGFAHVGTWPQAIAVGAQAIDVYWMTLTRAVWAQGQPDRTA